VTSTDFQPGQRITVADASTQTVTRMLHTPGEPARVEVEGGLAWLASECELAPSEATGTALGSMPEHADHPDVRAAITALDPLKPAELTGHELKDNPDASGFMVEPREDGNVAVYWLEDGSYRTAKGSIRHTQVTILANRLRAAGWTVRPGRSACVFAHTPPPMDLDGAIKQLAYELTLPGVQRNNELVIAHAEEIIRLAQERNYQASI
jgi:hypothetical protein